MPERSQMKNYDRQIWENVSNTTPASRSASDGRKALGLVPGVFILVDEAEVDSQLEADPRQPFKFNAVGDFLLLEEVRCIYFCRDLGSLLFRWG